MSFSYKHKRNDESRCFEHNKDHAHTGLLCVDTICLSEAVDSSNQCQDTNLTSSFKFLKQDHQQWSIRQAVTNRFKTKTGY